MNPSGSLKHRTEGEKRPTGSRITKRLVDDESAQQYRQNLDSWQTLSALYFRLDRLWLLIATIVVLVGAFWLWTRPEFKEWIASHFPLVIAIAASIAFGIAKLKGLPIMLRRWRFLKRVPIRIDGHELLGGQIGVLRRTRVFVHVRIVPHSWCSVEAEARARALIERFTERVIDVEVQKSQPDGEQEHPQSTAPLRDWTQSQLETRGEANIAVCKRLVKFLASDLRALRQDASQFDRVELSVLREVWE